MNNCPISTEQNKNKKQSRYPLIPEKTCKQNFELILDDGKVKMKRSYNETLLNPSEYCLLQYDGTDLFHRSAKICMKTEAENPMKIS